MSRWVSLFLYFLLAASLSGGWRPAAVPPQPVPAALQGGGEIDPASGDEISAAQELAMWEDIQRNLQALRSAGALNAPDTAQTVTFIFPLRMAPGLPNAEGFRISAFSDHNPANGQFLDYNGGTRTYDSHRGTDIALWPFSWNELNAGDEQVVAAAAGTIVSSANVDPTDHNCNVSSSDPWNYVALVHANGRMTIYGHMRYNSLTSKGIGQTVEQGEYLGLAGSSGNSSGPHLHFEERYGSYSNAEWIDPYAGPKSQAESSWAVQPAYYDSAINRLSTHSAPPSTPDPCLPSIPNLQDHFTTPARIYFYAFYRDYQAALATQLKIYRPDGSLYTAWQFGPNGATFNSAWTQGWVYDFVNSDPPGTWRFEAAYNNHVYETYFNLNAEPILQVDNPNGGEQLERSLEHSITWTDNIGGSLNIALYHNGAYSTAIVYDTPSDGEYLWTPDPSQALDGGYSLRISSVSSPTLWDESNAPFSIASSDALIARNDFLFSLRNTPVSIDVLSNDQSSNNDTLTITDPGSPAHGSASILDASILYTPAADFEGSDVFTYTVSAGAKTAQATVSVHVVSEVYTLNLPLIRH